MFDLFVLVVGSVVCLAAIGFLIGLVAWNLFGNSGRGYRG
jgi:hypothetical protein